MKTPDTSGKISEAEQRFAAEQDAVETSPAQPLGPDRIDDDAHRGPKHPKTPPNEKTDDGHRMKH